MIPQAAGRLRRVRVRGHRLVLFLACLYAAALMVQQQWHLARLQREIRRVEAELEAVRVQKAVLLEEIRQLQDPARVETEARRRFGLAYPDEVPYVVSPDGDGHEAGTGRP